MDGRNAGESTGKRRDEILKKEEEEKKKEWIRATAKTRFIQSATQFQPLDSTTWPKELTFDKRYIRRNSKRLCSLAFTDDEKKLLAETRKREREQRQQFALLKWHLLRKIEQKAFTQELGRAKQHVDWERRRHKRVIDFKNREIARSAKLMNKGHQ